MNNKYPTTKPSLNLDFANTKSLDPRINFRRGTPGTYYDGVTHAKAEENLIYPSIPDSNWTANEYSITTNSAIAPDGTTTASKIVLNNGITGSYNIEKLANVSINNFYTFSIYAKEEEFSIFNFDTQDSYFAQVNVVVDLSTGSIIEKGVDVIDSSITDVGNGWYRIVMTGVAIATGSNKFIIRNFEDTGDGSSGFYLWGAQLEQRDTVTSYTATNGTSITKYQPKLMTAAADNARFDHDPLTGESKGLLIEEQRTNLVTYSEDFSQWDRLFNVTVTSNTVVAPDGTWTGDLIKPSTSAEEVFVGQESFGAPSSLYSTTFYVKYAGIQWIGLLEASGFGFVYFDILNGVVGDNRHDGIGTITSIGNGWFRCSVFRNTATTSRFVRIFLCDANGSNYCTASDTKGIYVWGAQLEEGSFPTSYIKTTGASATRSADNASITGENFSSWYRQDEGSIYVDSGKGKNDTSFAGYVALHTEDFSAMEYYWILHRIPTDQFQLLVAPGIANLTDGIDTSLSSQKACVSWADDDFSMSVNGNTIQSDTDGPAKKNLTGLRIGFSPYSKSHYLNSTIKKLAYYPQRLTNEQLQNLTK